MRCPHQMHAGCKTQEASQNSLPCCFCIGVMYGQTGGCLQLESGCQDTAACTTKGMAFTQIKVQHMLCRSRIEALSLTTADAAANAPGSVAAVQPLHTVQIAQLVHVPHPWHCEKALFSFSLPACNSLQCTAGRKERKGSQA